MENLNKEYEEMLNHATNLKDKMDLLVSDSFNKIDGIENKEMKAFLKKSMSDAKDRKITFEQFTKGFNDLI